MMKGNRFFMREPITGMELKAAQNGEEPALAALITRYLPIVTRYARRSVHPGLDIDDAVQEGLIGLFKAVKSYEEGRGASFSTYAAICIQNAVSSAQKAAKRKKHAPLNSSVPIPEGQSIPGPEEQTIVNEQLSLTMEKMRVRLSKMEKAVMAMYLNGFSYGEIARKLGKTPKAVDNALTRIRRKLR